jgi:hypothetical protein
MTVPTFVPGQPSAIPEIPFAKKTDQEAVAKIAVFAYNRETGQPLWQSGLVQARSTSKDMWLLGAGPFQRGTIRKGTEFAGEHLAMFTEHDGVCEPLAPAPVSLTQPATWNEMPAPKTDSKQLAVLLGAVPVADRPKPGENDSATFFVPRGEPINSVPAKAATDHPAAAAVTAKLPPIPPNIGGQDESEPHVLVASGSAFRSDQ